MSKTLSRRGFTLVEMLVVIAIIGMLMGLLLPAVQSARESGRRTNCSNNLSQLAKATMAFDGAMNFLPGWRNRNLSATAAAGTAPTYSWPVQLLPQLERRDIFNAAATNTVSGSLPSTSRPYLDMFVCPSSPPESTTLPTLAYVANSGTDGAVRGNGVMLDTIAQKISLDFISDGDGNATTLLYSEKVGPSVTINYDWTAIQTITTGTLTATSVTTGTTAAFLLPTTPTASGRVINPGTASVAGTSNPHLVFPSSNHPGGVMAAFCGGHVLFLKDSIAPQVYAQLMTSKTETASATYRPPSFTYMLNEGDIK
jgi:prepilin-type N-terminal cleavage/methylation domain-containing protein/prepilin-type processing-associated H-X9-DG protein